MSQESLSEAILQQTDGGLQIIQDYYNDATTQSNKAFKIRKDEATASATLKQVDGTWIVADWGAWEKPKNAIAVCAFEDNLTYGEAVKKLAKLYRIEFKGYKNAAKAVFSTRPKTADEKKGDYKYIYRDEVPKHELAIFGPKVTNAHAKRFHLKSVKSYTFTTDTDVITLESTDDYPILAYAFGTWVKRYCPMDEKKANRFRYSGGRPKDHVFGLDDARLQHKKLLDIARKNETEDEAEKDNKPVKLPNIVICSGDRDAINMASCGYNVVWLNSESASLTADMYKQLSEMSDSVYNLPDLDNTGVREGVDLALTYLDLKTIWLPEYLAQSKDWRGNAKKDFTDFIKMKINKDNTEKSGKAFNKILKKMFSNALPMKFWDEQVTDKGIKYHYNIVHAEHFLKHQGFYRMETPFEKEEYCYIYIDGNNVARTSPNKIEVHVNNFLEKRQLPIPLRNMVKKTPYLKEAMLSKLPIIEIDFKDCDANTQYWFFNKNVVEIKKDTIKVHKKGVVPKMVMQEKIIEHPVKMTENNFAESFQQPHFKISTDADGDDHIEILKKDNPYLNYLINTSRMHWKTELEDFFKGKGKDLAAAYFKKHQFDIGGPNLEADEKLEQYQHLINKIYTHGYMLHKFKFRSRAWLAFGVDNKLSAIGESHGGSGKSIMYDNLERILKKQFFIAGRDRKALESEFLFDGVSEETDYVFIDDICQYFEFERFFSEITGKMKVNPKGVSGHTISFNDSPKLCGTSNFPPSRTDHSNVRRILLTVNSDYYHEYKKGEYLESRSVSDDFGGKQLFDDFTEEQHNDYYVFMAQCVQFYLKHGKKYGPPMGNVDKRNLMAEMGDPFRNWAEVYFSEENDKIDVLFRRDEAFKSYQQVGKKSANSFKKTVEAYCKYKEYIFNPPEIEKGADGRIVKRVQGEGAQEFFYIK
ncbi:MAG: hypothetical protein HRT69_15995 [Flavobacteriaceae bacterium]|nr:hypothetical protein [Flavobacteriaceae bacterium]